MKIAVCVIAVCEVIRIVQNTIQLGLSFIGHKGTKNVQKQFIDNLVHTDETFARNFAKEIEKRFEDESEG